VTPAGAVVRSDRKKRLACSAAGIAETVAAADTLGVADEERVAEDDAAAVFVADAESDRNVVDADTDTEGVDEGDGESPYAIVEAAFAALIKKLRGLQEALQAAEGGAGLGAGGR
jgi:hypothetical protein